MTPRCTDGSKKYMDKKNTYLTSVKTRFSACDPGVIKCILSLYVSTDLKFKKFPPQNLEKSNHIHRNCNNADIGNLMYGIPDLKIPRLSLYEFGKFLFLPTIRVVSMIQKLN